MSFNETPLIRVKAMTKYMAKQITVTHYNDAVGKEIIEAMKNDLCRPIAWASGEVLDGIPDCSKAWLIQYPHGTGNFYWLPAPYGGKVDKFSPEWMSVCAKNLPQVFIG